MHSYIKLYIIYSIYKFTYNNIYGNIWFCLLDILNIETDIRISLWVWVDNIFLNSQFCFEYFWAMLKANNGQ